MTVCELNELPYISANIQRMLDYIDSGCLPDFFLSTDENIESPIQSIFRSELESLISEYRRRMDYIAAIPHAWTRRIFEQRFIERWTFREIGVDAGIDGGTLKQEIYNYVQTHPEGFVSCRDLAEAWGVNINTVNAWCRRGFLPGAKKRRGLRSGSYRRWIIPADVERPRDRRPEARRKRLCKKTAADAPHPQPSSQ